VKLCITFGCRRFIKILPSWEIAVSKHFPSVLLIWVNLLFVNQTEILASHQMARCYLSITGIAFGLQN